MDKDTQFKSVSITFRNREHFYKIIKHINTTYGTGKGVWRMVGGSVLKHLLNGIPITRKVEFFVPIDETDLLHLSLL